MVDEIRPYQLVEIHSQAKSSRVNSWLFSLLAVSCGVGGFGFWFSSVPFKDQTAIACFGSTLFLASRASQSTKDAEKYGHRWNTLKQASEDAYLSNLVRSVQPGLPAMPVPQMLAATGNAMADAVLAKLAEFEVFPQFDKAIVGATFTRLMLKPGRGQPITQISGKAAELQVALGLENTPLISTKAGGVAIDLPNATRSVLKFGQYIKPESRRPTDALTLAVGINLENKLIEIDLSDPNSCHILGGGTTGSGKSEFLKSALLSLVARYTPESAQVAIIDPKRVTFPEFESMGHLWADIAKDSGSAVKLLNDLCDEMDDRYLKFEEAKVADIQRYNAKSATPCPRIVVLIDEYGELLDCSTQDEFKEIDLATRRLAQKARAAGIHLLVFTQRPDAKKLNPILRSNLPASVGLKVQRLEEAKIIMGIDGTGAENLLGKGDLLLRVGGDVNRLQALLIDSDQFAESLISRYEKTDRTEPQTRTEKVEPAPEPAAAPAQPDSVSLLERCLEIPVEETAPSFPKHLDLILECAKSKDGKISVRDAMRYPGLANKHTAEQVKGYFAQLEELALGKVTTDDRYGGRTLFELPGITPHVNEAEEVEGDEEEDQHWTNQLETWLQANPNPSDTDLKRQLKTLTGVLLDDNGVAILKQELGL